MTRKTHQQMSVDELRSQISQRLRSNAAFSQTVYQDQPIIMTASQLKSFVPDAIREARQLARTLFTQGQGVTQVFYQQARMLAGYDDDFEFAGSFSQYYPTYEDMSNEQLRGYFAWRTRVREGDVQQGQLSFAYLYLYELMNLVGVTDAQEGHAAMLAFGSAYRRFDTRFGRTLDAWLDDFVIYYGLDASLLRTCSHARADAAFDVLLHCQEHDRARLFAALVTLGAYPIKESPFYLEHAQELERLVTHAYHIAAQHHDKLKQTLPEKLAGRLKKERIWPFERAVFADPLSIEKADFTLSAHDTVFCRNGAWFRVRYPKLEQPLEWVTQLLETCECILRDAYAYPNTLERTLTTKYLVKAVESLAHDMAEDARLRQERAVHIDFSKLDHIRAAADSTCEKLIVEEEGNELGNDPTPVILSEALRSNAESKDLSAAHIELGDSSAPPPDGGSAQNDVGNEPSSLLTAEELALLAHLLAGNPVREFERAHAVIASVLVDSINDKLYDEFADICIDFGAGEPAIIEDYAQELRALLQENQGAS